MRIIRTIWNMIAINSHSINMFRFLYNECPVMIFRSNVRGSKIATAWSFVATGYPVSITVGWQILNQNIETCILHEVGHLHDSIRLKHKYWGQGRCPKITAIREKKAWKYALAFAEKYHIKIQVDAAKEWLAVYDGLQYTRLNNMKMRMLE